MPVLVSSVLESSSLGLIGHILSYKPRSIHTPHPRRIASMAESALDGSALGRVRGVTPPLIVTADSRDVSLCPFRQFAVPLLATFGCCYGLSRPIATAKNNDNPFLGR